VLFAFPTKPPTPAQAPESSGSPAPAPAPAPAASPPAAVAPASAPSTKTKTKDKTAANAAATPTPAAPAAPAAPPAPPAPPVAKSDNDLFYAQLLTQRRIFLNGRAFTPLPRSPQIQDALSTRPKAKAWCLLKHVEVSLALKLFGPRGDAITVCEGRRAYEQRSGDAVTLIDLADAPIQVATYTVYGPACWTRGRHFRAPPHRQDAIPRRGGRAQPSLPVRHVIGCHMT